MSKGISHPNDWYIPEVFGAAYESQYALSTLKYVFVDNMVDKETGEFCLTQLFIARNGLSWPPPENEVFVWRHGTAEFSSARNPDWQGCRKPCACCIRPKCSANCLDCCLSDWISDPVFEHALRS